MGAQRKVGLGRGISALIPTPDIEPKIASDEAVLSVSISDIRPNPRQPRSEFREDDLNELTDSILAHGIIQPLILTIDDETKKYFLIAGERRLRAAERAGLQMVPAIVRTASDQERLELALIENVQRADLSPLETAEAYRSLEENFSLTHEEIAKRVGKNRSSVTNTLRLLKLPELVLKALRSGAISEGHARALLGSATEQAQLTALQAILTQNLNVRQTEALVRKLNGEKEDSEAAKKTNRITPEIKSIEETLMQSVGTRVTLHPGKNGGTIHIHYYSNDELNDLIDRFSNFR